MNYQKETITQYINYIAVAYAFIIPLSRAGIGILTALFVLLWILEGNFRYKFSLYKNSKVIISLLLFILFGLISLIWTDDKYTAIYLMKRYWYLLPIFVFISSLKKEYISKILTAFILGMFVSEVIAYGVFFKIWHFSHATVDNPSPFMHHIEYSIFLALTALILLNRIFNYGDIKYKIFYALFFMTVTGNLFLTNGRTGQIAFIIGLFTLALLSFKSKIKALLVFIFLGAFIIIIAFNLSHTFKTRIIIAKEDVVRVIEKQQYCSSVGGRIGSWIVSKEIITSNPLLGVGIQDNMKEFHRIIDEKYPSMKCLHGSFVHTHNQFLQVLTSLGVVGLVIFLSIFFFIFRVSIKDKELHHIKYIYLAVLFFAFMPEVMWGRQFSLALSALIFGIILAQNRIEKEIDA